MDAVAFITLALTVAEAEMLRLLWIVELVAHLTNDLAHKYF